MPSNRGVVYVEPGKVAVQSIAYPKLKMPASETHLFGGKDAPHGVILKLVTTNICGSDQHMVCGRTTAPKGLILGHEITGEVIEKGRDVEMVKIGDLFRAATWTKASPSWISQPKPWSTICSGGRQL